MDSNKYMIKHNAEFQQILNTYIDQIHEKGACPDGIVALELPLTASCHSLLPGFESRPGHVRMMPVTLGFSGSGFRYRFSITSMEKHPILWLQMKRFLRPSNNVMNLWDKLDDQNKNLAKDIFRLCLGVK